MCVLVLVPDAASSEVPRRWCKGRRRGRGACLPHVASVFQGTGAGLKIQCLLALTCLFFGNVRTDDPPVAEEAAAVAASCAQSAAFPAGARHGCPWDLGWSPLARLCFSVIFTKMDAGALPVTCCRNGSMQITCGSHLFIKLIRAFVGFIMFAAGLGPDALFPLLGTL